MNEEIKKFLLDFRNEIIKEFEQIDNRFEQIDKKFEQIDNRFEQIDKKFEQIDNRFEQIDKKFEQIDNRFEQIDNRFEQLENRLDRHEGMIQQLIDIVGSTNKKVDSFIANQSEKLDQIQKQLDVIAAQQTDIELAHQKINKNERDIARIKAIILG